MNARTVMIVQMPAGVQNERLTNTRLADANDDGRAADALHEHNGLLVFELVERDARQQVVTFPPDEQFEQPMNERLAELWADGWMLVTMQSHNGFLVLLIERTPESGDST